MLGLVSLDIPTALANGAHYEYAPFGGVIRHTGAYADENAWRFSTKPFDAESGLGYWGYRYYSPTLGRWISRDPIGEDGGYNLYGYVLNQPTVFVDGLGFCKIGDTCYDVELSIMPGYGASPSIKTPAIVLLATVEAVQVTTRVKGAAGSYGASECFPSGQPGTFELSVSTAGLLVTLRQNQLISLWTRHRCSTCQQGFWNWVVSGFDLCKPTGYWDESDWSGWAKCSEPIGGYSPDAKIRGLSPVELQAYADRCVASAESRAASACGTDRPCGAPPECDECEEHRE